MAVQAPEQRDPLARIRAELVGAAGRRIRRRRARRRLAVAGAVLALGVGASAVAAGVSDFSTGVPVIDELLPDQAPRSGVDVRPGPGGASEPLPLPNSADGKDAVAIAYVNRDGSICKAQGDFRRSDGAPRGSDGGGDCRPPADLARRLGARPAICCGLMASPERRVYDGLAAGNVVALSLELESGRSLEARLTRPWKPGVPGAEPLRVFAAVDETDIDVGGNGVQAGELDTVLMYRFTIEARLADGRTVEVAPGP